MNDLNFAKNFAQHAQHKGNYLIQKELLKKGVRTEYIEEALSEVNDEKERAWEVALQKWPVYRKATQSKDIYEKKAKLNFFLASRGFSYSICREITQRISNEI